MTTTKVNLANTVEGILPVANGGTGTSTGVAPGGSTTQVQFNNSGAFGGSANFVFDGTNVGIGTSSPASQLEVKSAAFTDSIATINSTSTNVSQRLNFSANGTIQTQIYDDSAETRLNAVTSKPMTFRTANTERMRIDSSGNVGIGTSSQTTRLAVAGNQINFGTNPFIALSNAANTTLTYLQANSTTGQFDILTSGTGSNGFMTFSTGTGVEHMRLTAGGNLQFNSGYGSVATAYGCRAWANMGVSGGTLTTNGSAGISSITRTSTGYFTVAFSTTMPDANYSLCGVVSSGVGLGYLFWNVSGSPGTNSTTTMYFNTATGGGFADYPRFSIAVFR